MNGLTISQKLGVPASTVYDTIDRYKKTGSAHPVERPGRPPMLTDRDIRALSRITLNDREATLQEIREEVKGSIGITLSRNTTRKYLNSIGWQSCLKCKKPFITDIHAKKRLDWCREHIKWPSDEWRYVIFSDESRFSLDGADGGDRVWRRVHEKYHKDCVAPRRKFGGGKVMFWGCFTYWGVGPLVRVDGTMNASDYLNLLATHFMPWEMELQAQHYGDAMLFFQQDNASVHTAKKVKAWMNDQDFHLMEWPAHSPDLNPIENLWEILDNKIRQRNTFPKDSDELAALAMDEWKKIPIETIHNLIESMPRRLRMCINSKGWHTKY